MDKEYILFSDGTWVEVEDVSKINTIIKNHQWPFPLDIKGDPRRTVKILSNIGIEATRKGV